MPAGRQRVAPGDAGAIAERIQARRERRARRLRALGVDLEEVVELEGIGL